MPAAVGGRGVHQHRVGRPRPARREQAHRVEVTRGDEVDVAPSRRRGQAGRHVPRREPDLARVGGRAERIVVEPEPAHQGERSQPVGLPQDLVNERAGIATPRGEKHLHTGAEAADGVGEGDLLEEAAHEVRVV